MGLFGRSKKDTTKDKDKEKEKEKSKWGGKQIKIQDIPKSTSNKQEAPSSKAPLITSEYDIPSTIPSQQAVQSIADSILGSGLNNDRDPKTLIDISELGGDADKKPPRKAKTEKKGKLFGLLKRNGEGGRQYPPRGAANEDDPEEEREDRRKFEPDDITKHHKFTDTQKLNAQYLFSKIYAIEPPSETVNEIGFKDSEHLRKGSTVFMSGIKDRFRSYPGCWCAAIIGYYENKDNMDNQAYISECSSGIVGTQGDKDLRLDTTKNGFSNCILLIPDQLDSIELTLSLESGNGSKVIRVTKDAPVGFTLLPFHDESEAVWNNDESTELETCIRSLFSLDSDVARKLLGYPELTKYIFGRSMGIWDMNEVILKIDLTNCKRAILMGYIIYYITLIKPNDVAFQLSDNMIYELLRLSAAVCDLTSYIKFLRRLVSVVSIQCTVDGEQGIRPIPIFLTYTAYAKATEQATGSLLDKYFYPMLDGIDLNYLRKACYNSSRTLIRLFKIIRDVIYNNKPFKIEDESEKKKKRWGGAFGSSDEEVAKKIQKREKYAKETKFQIPKEVKKEGNAEDPIVPLPKYFFTFYIRTSSPLQINTVFNLFISEDKQSLGILDILKKLRLQENTGIFSCFVANEVEIEQIFGTFIQTLQDPSKACYLMRSIAITPGCLQINSILLLIDYIYQNGVKEETTRFEKAVDIAVEKLISFVDGNSPKELSPVANLVPLIVSALKKMFRMMKPMDVLHLVRYVYRRVYGLDIFDLFSIEVVPHLLDEGFLGSNLFTKIDSAVLLRDEGYGQILGQAIQSQFEDPYSPYYNTDICEDLEMFYNLKKQAFLNKFASILFNTYFVKIVMARIHRQYDIETISSDTSFWNVSEKHVSYISYIYNMHTNGMIKAMITSYPRRSDSFNTDVAVPISTNITIIVDRILKEGITIRGMDYLVASQERICGLLGHLKIRFEDMKHFLTENSKCLEVYRKRIELITRFSNVFTAVLKLGGNKNQESIQTILNTVSNAERYTLSDIKMVKFGGLTSYLNQIQTPDLLVYTSEVFRHTINRSHNGSFNDPTNVFHSIEEITGKFVEAREKTRDVLKNVDKGLITVKLFIEHFVELGETDYRVYDILVGNASKKIKGFLDIYSREKEVTNFMNMHMSMQITSEGLIEKDTLIDRNQTIKSYIDRVGSLYKTLSSYPNYSSLTYLIDILSNSSYILKLVLGEMPEDYDVSQFKTQLDMNTVTTINTDAAVALCDIIVQLRALRPYYSVQMSLDDFWTNINRWASIHIYPQLGQQGKTTKTKNHKTEMLLETVKSGLELYNMYRKLTKDLIELHFEKIRLISRGSALYSLYTNNTFTFTVDVNGSATEFLPVDIEELKTVAQISQNTAKTQEEEETARKFLDVVSSVEKLLRLVQKMKHIGLPYIKKLQSDTSRKQGFCDLLLQQVDRHKILFKKHLVEWRTKLKEMYSAFPKLTIIPSFYIFDFLAIVFKLEALGTGRLSPSVKADFLNIRNLFKVYGYDVERFIVFMNDHANQNHIGTSFEYSSSVEDIDKENYNKIGDMLVISGMALCEYTKAVGPVNFNSIVLRTNSSIAPNVKLTEFIKQTPISVIQAHHEDVPRIVYELALCEKRCPLPSEILIGTGELSPIDVTDFLKQAKVLNIPKLHLDTINEGANESLYYLFFPGKLDHKASLQLINFINKERERRVARMVIIHTGTKPRMYDEFLKCVDESTIFVYGTVPRTEPVSHPCSLSAWRHGTIEFIRSVRSGEGKTEYVNGVCVSKNLKGIDFTITSSDNITTTVERVATKLSETDPLAKYLIHFNLNLYKENIELFSPMFLQIFLMRGGCINTRYFTIPPQVDRMVIECREGTYNINSLFVMPATTLAFDFSNYNPKGQMLEKVNLLLSKYKTFTDQKNQLLMIKPQTVTVDYLSNKKLLIDLFTEFKTKINSFRHLNDIVKVYCRCAKGYEKFVENSRPGAQINANVIVHLTANEVNLLNKTIFEFIFGTAVDLCFYQFDEDLSSEISNQDFNSFMKQQSRSILKNDTVKMLFWVSDSGYVCNPFYRKDFEVPTNIKIIYESIANGRWRTIASLFQKPQERAFLKEIAAFNGRELVYIKQAKAGQPGASPVTFIVTPEGTEFLNRYSLTPDNALKMLRIYIKTVYQMPVVIIGESGVGKTELLRSLAQLTGNILKTLQIHAGTTVDDLKEFMAAAAQEPGQGPLWIFFDEANTSTCVQKIEEIVMNRTIDDVPVSNRFTFVIAVNPHREMTSKEANLYKEYRNPKFKETNLAYTVYPIPASLKNIAFNFGRLSSEEFNLYSHNIIGKLEVFSPKRVAISPYPGSPVENKLKPFHDLASLIVTKSYHYMADLGILISLRDVVRFRKLIKYFTVNMTYKPQSSESAKVMMREPTVQTILLAVYFVFYMRLPSKEDRQKYELKVYECFKQVENFPVAHDWELANVTNRIEFTFENECKTFTKNIIVPPNISLNKSLRENLFVVSTAIKNKIPIIIMGKPGTSKSLSMQIISLLDKNDTGLTGMPEIDVITYQGSRGSTSEGILKAYAQAGRLSKRVDKKIKATERDRKARAQMKTGIFNAKASLKYEHVTVFQFDEIGLAEQTGENNALKCLHYILEPKREEIDSNPAFVGISNYSLDLAKVNRCLFLCKLDPDNQELVDTSTDIGRAVFKDAGLPCPFDHSNILTKLTRAYTECITQQKSLGIAIYGLRNYYTMVQDIINQILADPAVQIDPVSRIPIPTDKLMQFVQKTFDVFPYDNKVINPLDIFSNAIAGSLYHSSTPPSPFTLINYNLLTPSGRHVMVITDRLSTLMELNSSYNDGKELTVSFIMDDVQPNFLGRSINKIRVIMDPAFNESNGQQLAIMCECEDVYPSLFSLLNGTYTTTNGVSLCRIAVSGSSNILSKISPKFRIIVVLFTDQLDSVDSAFINRFEIRHISTEYDLRAAPNHLVNSVSDKVVMMLREFVGPDGDGNKLVEDFPMFKHFWSKFGVFDETFGKRNTFIHSSILQHIYDIPTSNSGTRSPSGISTPEAMTPTMDESSIESIALRAFTDIIRLYDPIKRLTESSNIKAVVAKHTPTANQVTVRNFQSALSAISLRHGLMGSALSTNPVTILILDTHATSDILNKFVTNLSSFYFKLFDESSIEDLFEQPIDLLNVTTSIFNTDKLEKLTQYIKYIIPRFIQKYYDPVSKISRQKLVVTACLSAEQCADLHMSVSEYVQYVRVSNGAVNSSITTLIINRYQLKNSNNIGSLESGEVTMEIFNEIISDCLIDADFGKGFWSERKKFINRFREIYRTWPVCKMWLEELKPAINKVLDMGVRSKLDILSEIARESEQIRLLLDSRLREFLSLVFKERTILPSKNTIQLDTLSETLLKRSDFLSDTKITPKANQPFHEFPFFYRFREEIDKLLEESLGPFMGHSQKLKVSTLVKSLDQLSADGNFKAKQFSKSELRLFLLYYFQAFSKERVIVPYEVKDKMRSILSLFKQIVKNVFEVDIDKNILSLPAYLRVFTRIDNMPAKIVRNIVSAVLNIAFLTQEYDMLPQRGEVLEEGTVTYIARKAIDVAIQNLRSKESRRLTLELISLTNICNWGTHNVKAQIAIELNISKELGSRFVLCKTISDIWNFKAILEESIVIDVKMMNEQSSAVRNAKEKALFKVNKEKIKVYSTLVQHISNFLRGIAFVHDGQVDNLLSIKVPVSFINECKKEGNQLSELSGVLRDTFNLLNEIFFYEHPSSNNRVAATTILKTIMHAFFDDRYLYTNFFPYNGADMGNLSQAQYFDSAVRMAIFQTSFIAGLHDDIFAIIVECFLSISESQRLYDKLGCLNSNGMREIAVSAFGRNVKALLASPYDSCNFVLSLCCTIDLIRRATYFEDAKASQYFRLIASLITPHTVDSSNMSYNLHLSSGSPSPAASLPYDYSYGLLATLVRVGLGSPIIRGSRFDLQVRLDEQEGALGSIKISNISGGVYKRFGCIPLKPSAAGVDSMLSLSSPFKFTLNSATGRDLSVQLYVLANTFLSASYEDSSTKFVERFDAAFGSFINSSQIFKNQSIAKSVHPYVNHVAKLYESKFVFKNSLDVSLEILIGASCAEAVAKAKSNSFLETISPSSYNTTADSDQAKAFYPCMPSCDEIIILDFYGEGNIRGIIQCTKCHRIVQYVDNNCGQPADKDIKHVVCACGATGTIGDHRVTGDLKNYSQFTLEELKSELKKYRERFEDEPGFKGIPPGDDSKRSTTLYRGESTNSMYSILLVMISLMYVTQRNMEMLNHSSKSLFGKFSSQQLRQMMKDCLTTIMFKNKCDAEPACLFVLRNTPLIVQCFAESQRLSSYKMRSTLESNISANKGIDFGDAQTVAGEYTNSLNENIDPRSEKLINVATYSCEVDFYQRLANCRATLQAENTSEELTEIYKGINKAVGMDKGAESNNNNNSDGAAAKANKQQLSLPSKYSFLSLGLQYAIEYPSLQYFQYFVDGVATVSNIMANGTRLKERLLTIADVAQTPILDLGRALMESGDRISAEYGGRLLYVYKHVLSFYNGLPEIINMPQAGNQCGKEMDRPVFNHPEKELVCAFLMPTKSLVVNSCSTLKDVHPGEICLAACNTMCRLTQELRNLYERICRAKLDAADQGSVAVSINNFGSYTNNQWAQSDTPSIVSVNTIPHAALGGTIANHITLLSRTEKVVDYPYLFKLFVGSFITHKVSVEVNTDDKSVEAEAGNPTASETSPEQFCDIFINDLYQRYTEEYSDTNRIDAIAGSSSGRAKILTAALWTTRRVLLDVADLPNLAELGSVHTLGDLQEVRDFIQKRSAEAQHMVVSSSGNMGDVEDALLKCPLVACCNFYELLEERAIKEFIEVETPELFKEELPSGVNIKKMLQRRQTVEEQRKIEEHVRQLHGLVGRLLVRIFIPSYFCGSKRLEFHLNLVEHGSAYTENATSGCSFIVYLNGTESVDYIWNEYWPENGSDSDILMRTIQDNSVSIYHSYALWKATAL